MRKIIVVIFFALFCAQSWSAPRTLSDSAKIHLLTCTPGTEVWSKYGHTAIRVLDQPNDLDLVFNYGIFNLMSDDFYVKFVRGETYYQLGIEAYNYFDKVYRRIGRITYWQELNLTQEQKQSIYDALLINYRPENRYYLYNFVFDNCATRPYNLIKQALNDTIISDYQGYLNTPFRTAISHYTGPHSWVDFGINLVFGCKANQPMSNEQRLFLPEELMFYISQARLSDGTPLVKQQEIAAFQPNQVVWYHTYWIGLALFAIVMLLLSLWDSKRGRLSWGVDLVLGLVYMLLITLVIFLTFFSCHPLVGFNWRLLLLPLIHVCTRLVYIFR